MQVMIRDLVPYLLVIHYDLLECRDWARFVGYDWCGVGLSLALLYPEFVRARES